MVSQESTLHPSYLDLLKSIQTEKNCMTRGQFSPLSDAGSSRQDENAEDTEIVAEKSGISSSKLSSDLTSSPQKALATENLPHAKASSPPGNTDDYLSTIVNMDGGAFSSSANSSPKNSDDIFQTESDLLDSKESVEKTENKDDSAKEKLKIGAPPVILEQAEENDMGNLPSYLKSFESEKKLQDGDMPQNVCPKLDHDSCEDHVPDNQHGEQSTAENTGSGHLCEVGCSSQVGCMQIAQDSEVCENAVQFTGSTGEKMHDHAPKVGQHQHGISRRLQFEDGQNMADIGFQVSSRSAGYPRLPVRPADPEVLQSASVYKSVTPSNILLANNMAQTVFSPQNNGNYNIKVPKPSGIGLHLNSIIAKQKDSATKINGKCEGGSFEGLQKQSISITTCHLPKNCSISSNAVRGASVSSSDNMCDMHASIGASSSKSSYSMRPLFEPVVLEQNMQLQSNTSNKRNYKSELDCFSDLGQSSPKKKRNKTADAVEGNGCKRCNCKKTKCLKLYCDCFAAGIYCAEPCACEGCFNRPEYEDTVLETRLAIEVRNPLAFAPKIIQHNSESPTNVSPDDGDFTPSSGRHKRGCNCKKSKCLKKYCECYQANVGCSDGCRCEGCDNVYGRKEEYGTIKDMVRKQGNSQKLDSSFEIMLSKDGLLHTELYSPHNLTPLTPPFPCSINGKGASRAWFSSGRYLQSPESDLNLSTPFGLSKVPDGNPDNRDMIIETNTEIMDLVAFQQDFGCGNGHRANQLSLCEGTSNVDHLPPASLSNPQDWVANTSIAQIFPGNHNVLSESSLRWRRSPITPSTHFWESKFHEAAELYSMIDDDMPEILKDTMPLNAVKVSSPNKKRVSPPHGQRTEVGSCSSSGLKSRKFILRGVQTISPKTAYIESQADAGGNTDNSQSSSSSK